MTRLDEFWDEIIEAQGQQVDDPVRFETSAIRDEVDEAGPRSPQYGQAVAVYSSSGLGVSGESSN